MSGSKDVGNERGKGFAGLSTLIPDESTSDASAGKPSKSPASGAVKPSIPPAWESTVTPDERLLAPQSQTRPAKGIAWVAFTVVAIGLGALGFAVSERNTSSNSVPAGAPNHVVATQPPAQTQSQPPAREPSFPEEVRPSMGTNLVLSISEIRYCLAEAIRMEGAESSLNNYVDVDVDRFNVMVNDYNSRCGSFRYRSGALEGARRDIESHRARLKADGQARFLTPQQSDLHRSATGSDASSAAEMAGQGSQQQAQLGRAIDVVTQHFGAWSNGNELGLGQLELLYAPAVTYYGKSMPSGDVMEDKRKFSVRWPEREYTGPPSLL